MFLKPSSLIVSEATTDEDIINKFFDHLEVELEGIPPFNIFDFNETNLDDLCLGEIITKIGTKYPEKICNSSKCGRYQLHSMQTTCTENGSSNARYNRTSSGWFYHQVFKDWFLNLLLPLQKKLDGPKAIIGHNLSSHLNLLVKISKNVRLIILFCRPAQSSYSNRQMSHVFVP